MAPNRYAALLPSRQTVPTAAPLDPWSGYRHGTTDLKGQGYLGPLQTPDGLMTELSIGVNLDGREMDIPALVPTLTQQEVQTLLTLKPDQQIPKSVIDKAVAHARQRLTRGLDPFAGPGEQQSLYPDLPRGSMMRRY